MQADVVFFIYFCTRKWSYRTRIISLKDMFKIFTGNHLVEAYHRNKKQKRGENILGKVIKLLISIAVGITLWALPTEVFGIEGLTLIEQRVIGKQ